MQRIINMLIISSAVASFTGAAWADQTDTAIYNLPANGEVTLSGTVDEVGKGPWFMVRNDQGTIEILMPPEQTPSIKKGDNVTVTGVVKKPLLGILGSEIQASDIKVRKTS